MVQMSNFLLSLFYHQSSFLKNESKISTCFTSPEAEVVRVSVLLGQRARLRPDLEHLLKPLNSAESMSVTDTCPLSASSTGHRHETGFKTNNHFLRAQNPRLGPSENSHGEIIKIRSFSVGLDGLDRISLFHWNLPMTLSLSVLRKVKQVGW